MKSITGLSGFVIAPLTSDTSSGVVYGAVRPMTGAIDVSVTPGNADPNIQYADDVEFDVIQPDPNLTVVVELTSLPLDVQAEIGGHELDSNGVMIQTAGDTPAYYAIGFKGKRRDGGDRYTWLLKGRAKPVTETFHTEEGETVTRQTGKVEFTFLKRTYDGQYKHTADVGQNGFTTEKAATFLATVYTKNATPIERIGAVLFDVEAPVTGATPQATHDAGTGYTAAIAWSPTVSSTFAAETVYTATVTYTAAAGYIFDGGFGIADVVGAPETGVTVTRVSNTVVTVALVNAETGA